VDVIGKYVVRVAQLAGMCRKAPARRARCMRAGQPPPRVRAQGDDGTAGHAFARVEDAIDASARPDDHRRRREDRENEGDLTIAAWRSRRT